MTTDSRQLVECSQYFVSVFWLWLGPDCSPRTLGCSYLSIPPIPLLLRAAKHRTAITETGTKSGCCCSFSAKRVQIRAEVWIDFGWKCFREKVQKLTVLSSPGPKPQTQKPKTKGPWADTKISGVQREEGHGVVHHVQWEHHQSYLLHHYRNASIQGRQIQCRKDQMKVCHVEKNMVEQSSTVPNSQSIRST